MIPALTESLSTYIGNDVAFEFAFYFRAVKASDVLVKATVGVALPVTLVENVDYTYVASAFPLLGGTVTLIDAGQTWMNGPALKLDAVLTIQYNLSPSQISDIKGSPILLEVHKALDKLTMDMLALVDLVNTDAAAIAAFPSLSGKAGKVVQVNAAETGFEYLVTAQTLLDAETSSAASAAAALISKNAAAASALLAETYKNSTAADVVTVTSIQGQVTAAVAQASGHAVDAQADANVAAASAVSAAAQVPLATAQAELSEDFAFESERSANLLLYTSTVVLTILDSPYQALAADNGKLFQIDTSGGNFVFTLPTMQSDTRWRVSVVKTDSSVNTITVNPYGSDTILGLPSQTLTLQIYGRTYYQNLFSDWASKIFIDNSSFNVGSPGNAGGASFSSVQNVLANGTIVPGSTIQQVINVQGNAGPQNANIVPFSANVADGYIIMLAGQNDANILTIFHNDAVSGCLLKGDCYLGKDDVLGLVYDATRQRYRELFRSVH